MTILEKIYSEDFYVFKGLRNPSRRKYEANIILLKKAFDYCLINIDEFNKLSEKLNNAFKEQGFTPYRIIEVNETRTKLNHIFFTYKDELQKLHDEGYGIWQLFDKFMQMHPEIESDLHQIQNSFRDIIKKQIGQNETKTILRDYKDKIQELKQQGKTYYFIAKHLSEKYGVSERTIYKYCMDLSKNEEWVNSCSDN